MPEWEIDKRVRPKCPLGISLRGTIYNRVVEDRTANPRKVVALDIIWDTSGTPEVARGVPVECLELIDA